MFKYVPILKRDTSVETLIDFTDKRNLHKSFSPILEIGHSKLSKDIVAIKNLYSHFEELFVDYHYLRSKKNNSKWQVDSNSDIFHYLELLNSKPKGSVEKTLTSDNIIPVISENVNSDPDFDQVEHYRKIYEMGVKNGYSKIGLRVSFWYDQVIDEELMRVFKNLRESDFILVDSRTTSLTGKEKESNYDSSLLSFINSIDEKNPKVKVILLNSKFTIKLDNGEKVEHLHWPILGNKIDVYGYGDYVTEPRWDGGGNTTDGFSLTYYGYDERLFFKFHESTEIEVLSKLRESENLRGEINRHKGYCSYCNKLNNSIEQNKMDDDLKDKRKRPRLGRIHQLNSISVNEMNSPQPSMF